MTVRTRHHNAAAHREELADQINTNETDISTINGYSIPVQFVFTQDGDYASGTGTIPADDTIPQNDEGNEFMTLSITPTDADNLLKIEVIALVSSSTANERTAGALFQDDTENALAAMAANYDGNTTLTPQPIVFTHCMTAGTTSSTTFKFRAGQPTAGTTGFNGWNSTRIFGGVMASSITITEYKA